MTIPKTVLAGLLAAAWSAAGAQAEKPAAPPAEEKAAAKPKAAGEKPKAAEGPVIEIKRTGPPNCEVKPVMTDADLETCRRAGYGK